jgi:hypothetical protein
VDQQYIAILDPLQQCEELYVNVAASLCGLARIGHHDGGKIIHVDERG